MSEEKQALIPLFEGQVTALVEPNHADILDPSDVFFPNQTAVVPPPSIPSPRDRSREWDKAFKRWLGGFKAENTRLAYQRAWDDLLNFSGKQYWAIESGDVLDWFEDLKTRTINTQVAKGLVKKGRRQDRVGYSASTISQRLAAISSFFTFAQERCFIYDVYGRERALHEGSNPARAVRRPKTRSLGQKTDYLPIDDIFALLNVIKQTSVQGLRDYALFLGYIFTSRRNSEWRKLRWGDLVVIGPKSYYFWNGKNTEDAKYELAPPVWQAIQAYLKAAGRLDAMQDDDYIFIAVNDNATRFENVSALTWENNRPLALGTINRLLKKYARKAGFDARRIHAHVLRHSAAMMLDELGYGVKYISKHLAHGSVDMTIHYLDHMKGNEDQSWRTVSAALKLDLLGGPPSGKKQDT